MLGLPTGMETPETEEGQQATVRARRSTTYRSITGGEQKDAPPPTRLETSKRASTTRWRHVVKLQCIAPTTRGYARQTNVVGDTYIADGQDPPPLAERRCIRILVETLSNGAIPT